MVEKSHKESSELGLLIELMKINDNQATLYEVQ